MNGREELASETLRLQAGGTLNPRRHVYIERPQDAEALRLLIAGEYVNILSSRQMGKSSLMVRIVRELTARGARVASVDLAGEIGAPPVADSFYLSLLRYIARELDVDIALDDWWGERSSDSVNRRFIDFFQAVILAQIQGSVVICLDEIDSTLRLPYTDNLFTAIRGIYNQRATSPVFDRLTFCLLGVASPNELIKDRRTTPYNVGTTIELRDFDATRDDLRSLAGHLDPDDPASGASILDRVLHWTDGHPYLTVKLCSELAAVAAKTELAVDHYVEAAFTSLDRLSGDPHFQSILRFLETRLADGRSVLKLYTRILGGEREADQQTTAHAGLKLSGLVKRDDMGCLVVRNEIYRRLFDAKWAAAASPSRAGRWYRTYAIAASILLVALIGGGVSYYLLNIRPALEVRDDRIGDFLVAQGNLPEALKSYRDGLAIADRQAKANPSNAGWQRELSLYYTKIGDVLVAQGNLWEGMKSYRDGLAIADRLAKTDPGNADWQHDLSAYYTKIGDVLVAQGNLPEALKSYRDGLAIVEHLAEADPSNAGLQREVALSLSHIGDVKVRTGDANGAAGNYEQALANVRRLTERDAHNTFWLRDMTVTVNKLGDARSQTGDTGAAAASYDESLAIARRLAARDPSNPLWQSDLWFALNKLGEAKLSLGDIAAARGFYADGLPIIRRLASRDPGDVQQQINLVINLYRLARVQDGSERKHALKEALAILEKLQAAKQLTPDKIGWAELIRGMLASGP